MKKVIIMRGLPGSGKSRYVKGLAAENKCSVVIASADHYHYLPQPDNPDGSMAPRRYEFKPENARKAHDSCLLEFIKYINQGWGLIVVDNTNCSAWEISPYYRLAEVHGYEVEIVWLQAPLEKCMARGLHNVPLATVENMRNRMEREELPSWWKRRVFVEQEDGTQNEYVPPVKVRMESTQPSVQNVPKEECKSNGDFLKFLSGS